MLLHKNGKNLSTNETKVVSQDCPKFVGSPATSGGQRVKFILSERFSNGLWGSEVWLFSELINIVFILIYEFIEFTIFLHTSLVIYFSQYKEHIIYLISFRKFSDVLPAFTCARVISNLWSICLEVKIFFPSPYFSLCLDWDPIKEYSSNKLITACLDS